MKIRALIRPVLERDYDNVYYPIHKKRNNQLDPLQRFFIGIAGVLQGGLSPFEDGFQAPDRYLMKASEDEEKNIVKYRSPGISNRHTLLDTIYFFTEEEFEHRRRDLVGLVDRQIQAITHAWDDVVSGYNELIKIYISR